jgi:hypothetical protein
VARYFLHLRDGIDQTLDPEGCEYRTLDAVREAVLRGARELIAADVLDGFVKLNQRIDAEDAAGGVVHSLEFRDAVRIEVE